METQYIRRKTMTDDTFVTVVDVYDQAAGIGKEFEKLIESYGVEAVTDLMPKVIQALEQLEALAARQEKENSEIAELRYTIDQLEAEKNEKAQERLRYQQELEQIEDNWQKETNNLLSVIGKTQEENRRLKENLNETRQAAAEEVLAVAQKTEEKEIEVLTKLKDTVDRQREELRKVKRESSQKNVDCEALQAQLETVVKVNSELRRKNTSQKKAARNLLEEKLELETQLADKDQQISHITELIREQESSEESEKNGEARDVEDDDSLLDGVDGTEDKDEEDMERLQKKLSLIGKMVIDMKDPNRPRFTLNELRTVLMERNELKSKLVEVEDELTAYKPCSQEPSELENPVSCDSDENADSESLSSYSGEELPVQGPINKEPDEKLFPGRPRESGIRKFFKFVFGESSSQGDKEEIQRKGTISKKK